MKKVVIGCEFIGPFSAPRQRKRRRPAVVHPHPRVKHWAILSHGPRHFVVAIGAGGIRARKKEGDGATPRGRLRPVARLSQTPLRSALPFARVRASHGWCDDPRSAHYNRGVRRPFPASHEQLLRTDGIYDHIIITDHNAAPRMRYRGSAIFIHVAREARTPTAGCIAFDLSAFRRDVVPPGDYVVGGYPKPVARR